MLHALRIKNLALIEDLRWEPGSGLNTLTGETGAGKSILIDGLMLLVGERADKSLIRSGESSCAVEAEMELPARVQSVLTTLLEEIGAEPCDGPTLLLKRTLNATGANKQFVNGSPVTLQGLRQLGDLLLDLHGPHDHQSLLSVDRQLSVLDAFGKLAETRTAFTAVFDELQTLQNERAALQLNERERTEKIERLTHQAREIFQAQLKPDEDQHIERDYHLAHHAQQLLALAGQITELLRDGENAVLPQLAQVEKQLAAWQKLDPEIIAAANLNHAAITNLQELAATIGDYAERIDLDGARLRQLEERLNLLQTLKRRYAPTLAEVIAHGQDCERQLQVIESSGEILSELAEKESAAQKKLTDLAAKLSAARRHVAAPLAEKIQGELRELGFAQGQFQISCETLITPARTGADRVEFIFAPNIGEAPQPLRSIASSGEMARVMLAVKTTLAEVDEVPILIFDEVDANVGGETAWQVGAKLRSLGRTHQVLCITHQPQVAAQGQTHFAVEKIVKEGRTSTTLARLEKALRQKEIARMLGGENQESLALAQRMLDGKKDG